MRSRRVSAELTLRYGGGSVGAVGQLVGLEAGHGRGWESTRNEVVEGHQLTSSSLLPPTGSSVAEPHLQRKQDESVWFLCSMRIILVLLQPSVCVRTSLTGPLHGAELIEISTSGACNETHRHHIYVTAPCQQANTRGLFQLLKPMLN